MRISGTVLVALSLLLAEMGVNASLPNLANSSAVPNFIAVKTFSTVSDPRDWFSPTNPMSIAVGDFNGDGKPDLATANDSSPTVSVLLANGDGTFGAAKRFGVGSFPDSLLAEDLNNDGILDIAVANSNAGSVSILLGDGAGGFSAAKDFRAGYTPYSLAVADFNHDGNLDLVTANGTSNSVSLLLGEGMGNFSAPTDFVASDPVSVSVGDFNGDSRPDLALASFQSGTVQILLNNGVGGFGTPTSILVGLGPSNVFIADVNKDGRLDALVANSGSDNVSVLLGTGTGTFGAPTNYETGVRPSFVVGTDLNGDGKLDLAVANSKFNDISVLLGDGLGNFGAATTTQTGPIPVSIGVGDFNADGKTDLAVVCANSLNVWIHAGKGDGSFVAAPRVSLDSPAFAIVSGDFNRDGKLDLATANQYTNNAFVLLGDGTGGFGPATSFAVGPYPRSLATGDFNDDGNDDLVVGNSNADTVSILLGNRMGGFGTATNFGAGPNPLSVATGDFNGDGKLDLVVAANDTGLNATNQISILLGDGTGGFSAPIRLDTRRHPSSSVAVGDFNDDGVSDIAATTDDYVSIILGSSNGTFGPATNYLMTSNDGTPSSASGLVVGDFDGDGKLDLAVLIAGNVSLLLGKGDGSFGATANFAALGSAIALGDFNGDGKADIALTNFSVSILPGNGAGAFSIPSTDFGAGAAPLSLAVGDFNRDGRADLVVSDFYTSTLHILLNASGSPTNPIDDPRVFVRQHYLDFLNREPDQGGWDYWTARITECGNDWLCVHQRRIGVSAAFFIELEFQETGYVVYRLHRAAFGTWPNAPTRANLTFARFMSDRSQLAPGPGLPQSTLNLANSFVQRPEFKQAYPDTMTPSDFVNKLFDTANLTGAANAAQRQAAIAAITSGSKTQAQVLLDVIEIHEFKTREFNRAFVLMQYFGYLRRDPDQGGYDSWLDVLNNRVPNNFRAMVCAFLTSAEYQQRFGTSVTRTNSDCSQ